MGNQLFLHLMVYILEVKKHFSGDTICLFIRPINVFVDQPAGVSAEEGWR